MDGLHNVSIAIGVSILLLVFTLIYVSVRKGSAGFKGAQGTQGRAGGVDALVITYNKSFAQTLEPSEIVPIGTRVSGTRAIPLITQEIVTIFPFSDISIPSQEILPEFRFTTKGWYILNFAIAGSNTGASQFIFLLQAKDGSTHPTCIYPFNMQQSTTNIVGDVVFFNDDVSSIYTPVVKNIDVMNAGSLLNVLPISISISIFM